MQALGTWGASGWHWHDCPYRWDGSLVQPLKPDPSRTALASAAPPVLSVEFPAREYRPHFAGRVMEA